MNVEHDYLRSVEKQLRGIAPAHRSSVLEDLRGHFADAADAGQSPDEVIRGLGSAKDIAARAREEFGTDDQAADQAWRVLQWAAVIVAAGVGSVVAFALPSYTSATTTSGGGETTVIQTLYQAMGIGLALAALVPALIAAIPLVVPRRIRTPASAATAFVLTGAAVIGGFTIGGFFLPVCLLAWAALVLWIRLRGHGFGVWWRIVGAALTVVPIALALPVVFSGSIRLGAYGWIVFGVIALIAVLIAVRIRAAGWSLAAIGLTALVAGLTSGQLLTLAFVWFGGWWLAIGLAHAMGTRRAG